MVEIVEEGLIEECDHSFNSHDTIKSHKSNGAGGQVLYKKVTFYYCTNCLALAQRTQTASETEKPEWY